MKIGIFSDTFPPEINGVSTVSGLLYKIFKEHGHEVVVVTTGPKKMRKSFTVEGDIVRISARTLKWLYNYRMAFIYNHGAARYIKSLDLDVIHTQTEFGIGLFGRLMSKFYGIPQVYTYHTMYEDYTYYVTKGLKLVDNFAKRIVSSLSVFLSDSSTEFTTTSYKTRDALLRYGVTKYVNVVPNGIDLSNFEVDYSQRVKEYKKEHNLEDKFILLILGRLAQEKSNDIILNYLSDYVEKNGKEKIRLLVVGGGPDKPNLEKIAKEKHIEDITEFVGPVDYKEVAFYYQLADLFVSASVSETQGLTFIEAMASSALVLARHDPCLTGVITEGETGYFYDTSESFAEKLDSLLALDDEKLEATKQYAKNMVYERYSAEKFYDSMLYVYQRAMRRCW